MLATLTEPTSPTSPAEIHLATTRARAGGRIFRIHGDEHDDDGAGLARCSQMNQASFVEQQAQSDHGCGRDHKVPQFQSIINSC
jgi:hypothetical protein